MTQPTYPDPKLMDAWFTLMAEAMRGAQQARQAFAAVGQMSGSAAEWQTWMAQYLDTAGAATPESMEAWVEEWQKIMGVVPRQRYLALLERNAELERQLRQAQETIAALQALAAGQETGKEAAQQVMDSWNKLLEETLRTQSEWMQRWSGADDADPESD